jgi:hypothetical protein
MPLAMAKASADYAHDGVATPAEAGAAPHPTGLRPATFSPRGEKGANLRRRC